MENMTTTTAKLTDWEQGIECDKHDLAYCATCREQAKIRRNTDGTLGFESDCAVRTFRDITGASYLEAVEALEAVGFRPGHGTPAARRGGGVVEALRAAGYMVCPTPSTFEEARRFSANGSTAYVVSATTGSKGHAWAIVDGATRKGESWEGRRTFRYQMFRVEA